jgi:phenylalanyl-tRNA synthetase beta chain
MKFTISWLRDHLDTNASLDQISETLTAIGLEVEEIKNKAAGLNVFTVGRVVEARPHPDADRLQICTVDTGSETLDVVCGAPNARTGMKGVYAPVGSIVPGNGMKLKAAKIRGVQSRGMLCSEREMGLSDEHEGIIELPEDAPLGEPFARVLGLDDPMIEIAITPNRQDCLGIRGIARDLAAAGLGTLKPYKIDAVPGTFESPICVDLRFDQEVQDACPMFVGRHIRNVKNGPSPKWLQDRLQAIGLRPISALVDMTNYLTFDLARPLHVFDADTLSGGIHVRLAAAGEVVAALNDREYTLDPEVTVIADDDGALALGGVIGGEPSGCTEQTTSVFIEAALFDPIRTAATGRRYMIDSDARYRFERGVDPEFVRDGMEVATRLVLELCGGEPSELVVAGEPPKWRRDITLRLSRIHKLSGIDIPQADVKKILESLGFEVTLANDEMSVWVPPWRSDVHGEADLVEEVTRIYGFNEIPSVAMANPSPVARAVLTAGQRRERDAKRVLAGRGLIEVVTWSFTSTGLAKYFGDPKAELNLANPISSDLNVMRPSLLANLLGACGRNFDRGESQIALFEVGAVYEGVSPDDQRIVASGLRHGRNAARHWAGDERNVDAFDAKADVMAVLEAAGTPLEATQTVAKAPDWYHPGRSGTLWLGPKTMLAQFGELHPRILQDLDIEGPISAFETFLDAVPLSKGRKGYTRARLDESDLPAVDRDFAFVLSAAVPAGDVARAAAGADKSLIVGVSVFDVFEGDALEVGQKSLGISVRLQPTKQTLTEAEIEGVSDKIMAAVEKATGGRLRI